MTCRHFTLVRRAVGMEHPVITQSFALAGFGFDGPFNKIITENYYDDGYLLISTVLYTII